MSLSLWLLKVEREHRQQGGQGPGTRGNDGLRLGQRFMNHLIIDRSAVCKLVHGTDVDCFYDDTRIPAFRTRLWELWDTPEEGSCYW